MPKEARHLLTDIKEEVDRNTGKLLFQCCLCPKSFQSKSICKTHIKRHIEGIASYNYDQMALPTYENVDKESDSQEPLLPQQVGINYTENLYRISPAIPVLTIHHNL